MAQDRVTKRSGDGDESAVQLASSRERAAVTWRSLAVGLLGVLFICGVTPYNDFVLDNTFLVGNFMPIGLVLFILVLVILVNGPLWKWAPVHALGSGELAVVLGMMLVAATLPNSGLMRYLPVHLVALHHHSGPGGDALQLMRELDLPEWMFPSVAAQDIQERATDPVVSHYFGRVPIDGEGFVVRAAAVPWSAWARPLVWWGVFLIAMYSAVICLAVIVRRQWAENERLAFPLAQIYLSLIEQPSRGRWLNALFSARAFWVGFLLIFAVRGINALHLYAPRLWPEVPLGYDLTNLFSEGAWRHMEWAVKRQDLFLSIVGITFFLQTKVAFSLWAFMVLFSVALMVTGELQVEVLRGAVANEHTLGAVIVFAAVVLWVGRQHWMVILRQMVRGAAPGEPEGGYLPYWAAGWGLAASVLVLIVWLVAAGATVIGAVVIISLMLLLFMVIARVVAETGLFYAQIPAPLARPFIYFLNDVPEALAVRTTTQNYFFATWFHTLFTHDLRENSAPFVTHAMRVADGAAYEQERNWRRTLGFTAALGLALLVGFFVAGAATLYVSYSYATTQDVGQTAPINPYGFESAQNTLRWAGQFLEPRSGPADPHHRLGHFAFGAGFTALLSVLRLTFVSWPLHPIGFLLLHSYPMKLVWFSIFIGWLLKAGIVRFGGAELYRAARPLFIGVIIGEAGAAAFWSMVSLSRHLMGLEYHAVRLFPS